MEHLKHFFKQKGLYLACLAVVFAATAAGVLALRSVLNHVVELTGTAQEETPWQDDTTVNKPDTTQPEPVRTPAPASSASCARCIAHTRRFCRAVRCCGKAFGLLAG